MTHIDFDESQRKAALVAGISFPISFLILLYSNFGIFARVIVTGDATETANNIITNETLFRVGIVGDIVYAVGIAIMLNSLYTILKQVNRSLALLSTLSWFIHSLTWLFISINLFKGLRLLTDPLYAKTFSNEQLASLTRLFISGYDTYYIGLLFWAIAAAIGGYLWLKSKYISRWLAVFGIISSIWCIFCTCAYYIFPGFATIINLDWFDIPLTLFCMILSVMLIMKGTKRSKNPATQTANS